LILQFKHEDTFRRQVWRRAFIVAVQYQNLQDGFPLCLRHDAKTYQANSDHRLLAQLARTPMHGRILIGLPHIRNLNGRLMNIGIAGDLRRRNPA